MKLGHPMIDRVGILAATKSANIIAVAYPTKKC